MEHLLKTTKKNHRWSNKELTYIKENGMKTDRELSLILQIPAHKIKACRKRHGIKKKPEFMHKVLSNIKAYGGGRPTSRPHRQSETDSQ